MLRRTRRDQALGFSLDEIRELLNASRKHRLAALRTRRDAVRQRAAETADVVRAIDREITAEKRRRRATAGPARARGGPGQRVLGAVDVHDRSSDIRSAGAGARRAAPVGNRPDHGRRRGSADGLDPRLSPRLGECRRRMPASLGGGRPRTGRTGRSPRSRSSGRRRCLRGTRRPSRHIAPALRRTWPSAHQRSGPMRWTIRQRRLPDHHGQARRLGETVPCRGRRNQGHGGEPGVPIRTVTHRRDADGCRPGHGRREIDALAQRTAETSLRRIRVGTSAFGQRTGSNNRNWETRFAAASRRP